MWMIEDDEQPDSYELGYGHAQEFRDLEMAFAAQVLRGLKPKLARPMPRMLLHRRPPQQEVSPPAGPGAPVVRCEAAALLPLCKQIANDQKQSFLQLQREIARREAEQAQYNARLNEFRFRLIYAGATNAPKTWSLLGWLADRVDFPLALSRDRGHLILVTGTPGSGKSVFGTLIGEGALEAGEPMASSTLLPNAFVFFHIEEDDRLPSLLEALKPNPVQADMDLLRVRLGVPPQSLSRVRIAVAKSILDKLRPRLRAWEALGLEVVPLKVHLGQLAQPGLEAALGAETGSRFVQRMLEDAQQQGEDLTIAGMRRFIDEAEDLNIAQKRTARAALTTLDEIASEPGGPGIWEIFEPGVATIVYLGGPHMGHGKIAPILVALISGLMLHSETHGEFQRTIVVDEVNLLSQDEVAWKAFERVARLVRHRGSTLVLMGQDLKCVPDEMFGLAGMVVVFQQANPVMWEHTKARVGALQNYSYGDVSDLLPAEAIVALRESTAADWQRDGRKVKFRPPRCKHGGETRGMV